MKHFIFLSIFAFLISCNTWNSDKKANEKVVNDMLVEFLEAIEKNDYDVMERITHKEFIIYENGTVWDLGQLSTELENFKNVKVTYTLGEVHSIVDEKVSYLHFNNNGNFVYSDTTINLDFIESATFVKEGSIWYLRFYHSTHLKRDEEY